MDLKQQIYLILDLIAQWNNLKHDYEFHLDQYSRRTEMIIRNTCGEESPYFKSYSKLLKRRQVIAILTALLENFEQFADGRIDPHDVGLQK